MKPELFDAMIFHRSALSVFKRIAPTSSLCSSRLWVFCCSGWWPVGLVVRPPPACRAASHAAAMPKAKEASETERGAAGTRPDGAQRHRLLCVTPGCPYLAYSDPRMCFYLGLHYLKKHCNTLTLSYVHTTFSWSKRDGLSYEWKEWFVTRGLHVNSHKNLIHTISMLQCKLKKLTRWDLWKADMLHVTIMPH